VCCPVGAVAAGSGGFAAKGGWTGLPVDSGGRRGALGLNACAGASCVRFFSCSEGASDGDDGVDVAGAVGAALGGSGEIVPAEDGATEAAGADTGSSRVSAGSGRTGICFPNRRRRVSATSSSTELECVFFSVTPNCGRSSIICRDGTSSSRASSLMRIMLRRYAPHAMTFSHC